MWIPSSSAPPWVPGPRITTAITNTTNLSSILWRVSMCGKGPGRPGPSFCVEVCGLNASALHRDSDRPQKAELQACFRRQRDVFLPCRCRARGARSRADQAADQGAFAATGQPANQRAARCASTDEANVALVVILSGFSDGVGVDVIRLAGNLHRSERHAQARRNVQAARLLRVHNAPR